MTLIAKIATRIRLWYDGHPQSRILWHAMQPTASDFQLGPFQVQPMHNQLQCAGDAIGVGPRAMDVLVYLAQHSERVVTRDELHDAVWKERVVVDEALSRCISELRHAFRSISDDTEVISTFRGRGYQMAITPQWQQQTPRKTIEFLTESNSRLKDIGLPLTGALSFLAAVMLWVWFLPPQLGEEGHADGLPLVAVRSFENLTGNSGHGHLANNLSLELSARLARSADIMVLAPQAVNPVVLASMVPARLSHNETADFFVDGSLSLESAGLLQLAITVVARDGHILDSETILLTEGQGRDDAMLAAVDIVGAALNIELNELSECAWSTDNDAMELYFQARARVQARRRDNIEAGIGLLKEALKIDPAFAQARGTLAIAYLILPAYMDNNQAIDEAYSIYRPLAMATAEEALRYCDVLGEAWMVKAGKDEYSGDNSWIGQGYALRKSIFLEPNNDDLAQHHADILERAGKIDEAMEYYAKAHRLNPYNARVLIRYSLLLVSEGEYDKALSLDEQARVIQGYPVFRVRFGVALMRRQWQEARDILDQPSHPMPEVMRGVLGAVVDALETPELRYIAVERMRELSSLEVPGKLNFIYLYGGLLAANDLVFEALAAAQPDVNFWFTLFWQPETTALLSDSRLHQYFEDVGLMEYWQVFGPPDACTLEPTFSCGGPPGAI